MLGSWATFAAPLIVFGVVTFLVTWWLRGRGFGEFRVKASGDDRTGRDDASSGR